MRKLAIALVAALVVALGGITATASAVVVGNEGCTPGFWKNHPEAWNDGTSDPGLREPTDLLSSVFKVTRTTVSGLTLQQALEARGGAGVAGAERILARAAVAAYLNAVHDGLGFPLRRGALITAVNAAFASQDRATMLALATRLDALNNAVDGCPL